MTQEMKDFAHELARAIVEEQSNSRARRGCRNPEWCQRANFHVGKCERTATYGFTLKSQNWFPRG